MTEKKFKVGDKVRRINNQYSGMMVGDIATITEIVNNGNDIRLDKYMNKYMATHMSSNFELVEEMKIESSGGVKFDNGKPQMRFLTREFLEETAKAHNYGAKKYGDFNFMNGIETLRLYDACLRHLIAWQSGEDLDKESGDSHLGHAAANLNMLIWMLANKPNLDNRYKGKTDE